MDVMTASAAVATNRERKPDEGLSVLYVQMSAGFVCLSNCQIAKLSVQLSSLSLSLTCVNECGIVCVSVCPNVQLSDFLSVSVFLCPSAAHLHSVMQ